MDEVPEYCQDCTRLEGGRCGVMLKPPTEELVAICKAAGWRRRPGEPAITCSSCRYFHLNHEDLPDHRRTGHHGLCINPFQPRQAQHESSVRCAWWERREGPVATCNAVVVQHCRRLAVLLAGDEELITEIERRGYRVYCPEVLCPECGEMRSVSPQEAGREVVCEFCGEKIDTSILVGGEPHVSIAGTA